MQVCVVYVVKSKLTSSGGLGQLKGMASNRMHAQALQTRRKKSVCSFTAYVETGTHSELLYLKYIPKVLQVPLKVRRAYNQNNNYNRLLCLIKLNQP